MRVPLMAASVLFTITPVVLVQASARAVEGQQQEQNEQSQPSPQTLNISRTTVHGTVKNAATGEPLPRALVRIEGDSVTGTLTDGDGRFEMRGVPIGPQAFQITKPGFGDPSGAGMMGGTIVNGATNSEHNVHVAADMPELVFNLTPTNSIRGEIALSTGDPAQSIGVMLLRRSVQDGRAVWQAATNVRTNSRGIFRFSGLTDGIYIVYTEPAMDTEIPASLLETNNQAVRSRSGFPSMFYPDSRDLAGAAKIRLGGGQQGQVNLLLPQEEFHLVKANVTLPGAAGADRSQLNVTVVVQDAQGHQLPYTGQYDQASHTVQAFLPDGTYSFLVSAMGQHLPVHFGVNGRASPDFKEQFPVMGQVDFSVASHPVTNLQIPLSEQHGNTVQLAMIRSSTPSSTQSNSQGGPLVVMLSQAGGWITDGMVSAYAEGYATGPLEATFMNPGSYWVHTNIPQKSLCEASFTAGGASLAREPLVLSLSGASAPLTLTLRDDCAKLTLSLPNTVDQQTVGEEGSYTVYVVPDFDSTTDITPVTLRPSSGGTFTLDGLTPGPYHVYTFRNPVDFEYRNPEALAALPNAGQAITLAPSVTNELAVEVSEH